MADPFDTPALVASLTLEETGPDRFVGRSVDLGWGSIFGGQVLAQALDAAERTVPADRPVHAMHAWFLRRGDARAPVTLEVERVRDGGSFTTRRVRASQGAPIFEASCSFQTVEPGLDHQAAAPDVPGPDDLPPPRPYPPGLPAALVQRLSARTPIEMRVVDAALVERISGRFSCKDCGAVYHDKTRPTRTAGKCDSCGSANLVRRPDDKAETVAARLKAYHDQTAPIIPYYRAKGTLKAVDGMAEMDAVTGLIATVLGKPVAAI